MWEKPNVYLLVFPGFSFRSHSDLLNWSASRLPAFSGGIILQIQSTACLKIKDQFAGNIKDMEQHRTIQERDGYTSIWWALQISPTRNHIIKYQAPLFWWVSKRKGRDQARQNSLLVFLIPLNWVFLLFYSYWDKHWNIKMQITNLTQTCRGHWVQGHALYHPSSSPTLNIKCSLCLKSCVILKKWDGLRTACLLVLERLWKILCQINALCKYSYQEHTLPNQPSVYSSNGCSSPLRHFSAHTETKYSH